MKWHAGKLYVSGGVARPLIAIAASLELVFVVAAMFVDDGAIAGVALMGAFVWPIGLVALGAVLRTEDPSRVTRAGALGYCTACGSDLLVDRGPGVYECRECGYLGGPGYAEARARERYEALRAELAGEPEAERRAQAIADLDQAKLAFAAARGHLQTAAVAIRTREPDDDRPIPGLEVGTALFVRANALVADAEVKLGASLGISTHVDAGDPGQDAVAASEREAAVAAALGRLRSRRS